MNGENLVGEFLIEVILKLKDIGLVRLKSSECNHKKQVVIFRAINDI